MIKARKELGIKGFCAINGAQRSTSEWCVRASCSHEVQTDQQVLSAHVGQTDCLDVCQKEKQIDFHGAVPTDLSEGTHDVRNAGMNIGTTSSATFKQLIDFKVAAFDMMWNEVKNFHIKQIDNESWKKYMLRKLFLLDHLFQGMAAKDAFMKDKKTERPCYEAFSTIMKTIDFELQIAFFLQQQGLTNGEVLADEGEYGEPRDCASGNTEDVTRDAISQVSATKDEIGGKSFYKDFANKKRRNGNHHDNSMRGSCDRCLKGGGGQIAALSNELEVFSDTSENECLQGFRGGMANRFGPLADADEASESEAEAEVESIEAISEQPSLHEVESQDALTDSESNEQERQMDTSAVSSVSGKSYYAAFFERKKGMQGGAGGSSTTQNAKLTKAMDALADVMKSLDTQPEANTQEDVIQQIGKLVEQWKNKTPTRGEMREQLRKMHVQLEQDVRRQVDPKESREQRGATGVQQSFYGEFVQRLREEQDQGFEQKGHKKGKGKGKTKSKTDKAGEASLPRFDVKKVFPSKALTTWQLMSKELEAGKEPGGEAVVLDHCNKMAEFQSLTKAHGIKRSVTMIAKAPEEMPANIENAAIVWLPYMGNLALARAIVATTTGCKTCIQGMEPVKKEANGVIHWEKGSTLRITVDLWLIADAKVRELLKQKPHAALHHMMANTSCREVKTNGWIVGDNLMTGYATVSEEDAKIILRQSGASGVFASRLQQDMTEKPPVTWVKMEEGETVLQYHERVMTMAKNYNVAAARRSGGGAFLGYLMEDPTPRNHAWEISGVPFTWGPTSVKNWLVSIGWAIEAVPRAPNAKSKSWSFQGLFAEDPTKKNFAFEVDCGSNVCHLTIHRWVKKRVPKEEEKEQEHRVRGTRWWSADNTDPMEEISPTIVYEVEVAPTKVDETQAEDQNGDSEMGSADAANKREKDDNASGSPAKQPPAKKVKKNIVVEPILKSGSQGPGGSVLLDLGGGGDCGWRALSMMISLHNQPAGDVDRIAEKIETLSTTLRAKTINFLTVNCSKWQQEWIPDPAATNVTEGGAPAKDLQSFIQEVLPRPARWVCGLCLAGVSLMKGYTVVVWQYKGGPNESHKQESWKRAAVIRGKKESAKQAIIPVVLHNGHYYALRLPPLRKQWPKEWALTQSEEKEIAVSQEMSNTQTLAPLLRGGGKDDPLSTPKKKGKSNYDIDEMLKSCSSGVDVEELLRSCSSSRTSLSDLLRTCSSKKSKKEGSRTLCEKGQKFVRVKHSTWCCPVCEETVNIGNRIKACGKITDHMRRRHWPIYLNALTENSKRNRGRTNLGMVGLVQPIPFQHMEKEELPDVEFVCPYCDMALPCLSGVKVTGKATTRRYLAKLSKKQHLRFDCKFRHEKKDVTLRNYHFDYTRKYKKYDEVWYLQSSYLKRPRDNGHEPVAFRFEKRAGTRKTQGLFQAVCQKCRKAVSVGDKARVKKCGGEAERKLWSPGLMFWKRAESNKKLKEVKDKLGMTQKEINSAKKAAEHWCGTRCRLAAERKS